MNSKRFASIAVLVSLSLLAGCSYLKSEDTVPKSALTKMTEERDGLKNQVAELQKRKPVEVVTGMSPEQCTKMGEDIVASAVKAQCTGKPVVKYLPAKQSTSGASARASAHTRADAQVAVAAPQAPQRAPSGCIHVSDGTLLLKGQSTPQPKDKEVGRIADGSLQASNDGEIKAILARHPNAFVTDVGHAAMCTDWRRLNASRIQEQKGFKFNNDTHRVPG